MDPAQVRELFDYRDGGLYWKVRPAQCIRIGDAAGLTAGPRGYSKVMFRGVHYKVHRVVWALHRGCWPRDQIDHINGVRSDNRIENLREADNSMNAENKRGPQANNRCGLLGVWPRPAGRYAAQIESHGRAHWLGTFDTPEEAHQAYLTAKRQLHAGNTL
jgi:hypothetical protein